MRSAPLRGYGAGMPTREPVLTLFIRPADEERVVDMVARRYPDMPELEFATAADDPSLHVQWTREHPDALPADRRCRDVLVDTSGSSARALAERVLDVISPHARLEDAQTPPFRATPDEFPWSAHSPLWATNGVRNHYYALAVFEVGTQDGAGTYYREDSYLISAVDLDDAKTKFVTIARAQEYESRGGDDRSYLRLAHVIDVAPTLYDVTGDGAVDLYSRHFASIEDYAKFEMALGGRDPLPEPPIEATEYRPPTA